MLLTLIRISVINPICTRTQFRIGARQKPTVFIKLSYTESHKKVSNYLVIHHVGVYLAEIFDLAVLEALLAKEQTIKTAGLKRQAHE